MLHHDTDPTERDLGVPSPWPARRCTDAQAIERQPLLMRCAANECSQGRQRCPCPDACQVAEDDDGIGTVRGLLVAVGIAGAAVVAGLVIATLAAG